MAQSTDIKTSAKKLKIVSLDDINNSAESPEEFIRRCENTYTDNITRVADGIAHNFREKPIILLSGPSGSGKTTSACRIAQQLLAYGIHSVVISMDDYFRPGLPEPSPDGKIDFERPDRVDTELLAKHLDILADGGEIILPKYDFTTNLRGQGFPIRRDKNTAVIVEGIHALNPDVIGGHDSFAAFVYVSVRTRIADRTGELLHPSKIRLLRRLSRDKLFRGRDYKDTVLNFSSVQRGESLYILPFKSRADYDIDTFFGYELSVYRSVLPSLYSDFEECERRADMYSVLPKFLKNTVGINPELVPENSMVKEFIG